jgi:hypothetical protein
MIDCGPSEECRYTLQKIRRLYMKRVSTGSIQLLSNKTVYIGIDVHKDSWHVTARTEGEEIFNGRIPASYNSLMKLLERFKDCRLKVIYEAGPCGFSLHDKLMEDGIDTIVVPPSLIPIESGNRVKTDKRDSRKLARLLESDMLKKVFAHRRRADAPGARKDKKAACESQGKRSPADKKQAPLPQYIIPLPKPIRMGPSLPPVVERNNVSIAFLERVP